MLIVSLWHDIVLTFICEQAIMSEDGKLWNLFDTFNELKPL